MGKRWLEPEGAWTNWRNACVAISGAVMVFSHSHAIRILSAHWVGVPAKHGSMFKLAPAHLSVIGMEKVRRIA